MLTVEQAAYLDGHRVARLATVGIDGHPHVLPVCFTIGDSVIFTPLDQKPKRVPVERLRRVQDLQMNPFCCLLVDDYDEDWTLLRWLQVRGEARLVHPGLTQAQALTALRQKYVQYQSMALEALPVIAITPVDVREWAWRGRSAYAGEAQPLL